MIRQLQNKDIDKIMGIWLESTIYAHKFISKEYWNENYNIVKDVYIPMSKTFIYEDNDDIRGFISIINNDFIGALFVEKNYQSQGIGKSLIDYAKNLYDNLSLAVYKENEKALEFYKKMGFKIISENINEDTNCVEYIMKL
ncbi:MAG: N-acetyltransferase [Terrisporobacter sp.]|uniref:N-acetyltransferase n=1 Tax=Terrisporobacter sp. TaxID=1965305 RepID=UPI002A44121B|nr:N-acetyltransferase [Terrisporobacter sp.]MCI6457313.1 N-acetyltransferase [Clostridium sp.]MDD5879354.1 N-acetyltransferase [Clostridiales bacterium]MCI7206633.1 N-acetyltransferase [Clostridium sp.]MDY4735213.1 N-acetyltransferase [Terrisporobacter sp.]MDY6151916.1 N-acetyltransferase [Terrisporobacter sp.]